MVEKIISRLLLPIPQAAVIDDADQVDDFRLKYRLPRRPIPPWMTQAKLPPTSLAWSVWGLAAMLYLV